MDVLNAGGCLCCDGILTQILERIRRIFIFSRRHDQGIFEGLSVTMRADTTSRTDVWE